jgi:hypothetical protein
MRTLVDKVSGGAAAHRKIVSAAFHSTRETPPTGLCCGIALFISIFIYIVGLSAERLQTRAPIVFALGDFVN